ncbi:MAG: Flp/Fap pilin component [Acidimicrobiaceae bacterium]
MKNALNLLLLRLRDDRGASLVEYALLIAFIAIVCVGAMAFLGTQTSTGLSQNGSSMFTPN